MSGLVDREGARAPREVAVTLRGHELPARDATDVAALLRALGGHRYVGSRDVTVHAAAFAALRGIASGEHLDDGLAWAEATLALPDLDPASRDERLYRRASEREASVVLEALWTRVDARDALRRWLDAVELPVPDGAPFDEASEDDVHPLLVDAGWELLPLRELDPARHAGAIGAFADPVLFESARFEEEDAVPAPVYLQELSAIGPVEILRGLGPSGLLVEPVVLYTAGHDVYQDYVLRGVLRAAKLV